MLDPGQVSACLVTRGDLPWMIDRIRDSLLEYDEVIVWDNSKRENFMTAGRFAAMYEARNEVCYVQDDDVIVPPETQVALLAAYEPGMTVANYGHGSNDGGYGDLPLVCGGGLMHVSQVAEAVERYVDHYQFWGRDEDAYIDFLVGVQVPFKQIHEPFHINYTVAQHASRLVNQPWAADAKARVTNRARALRDFPKRLQDSIDRNSEILDRLGQ